MIVKEFDEIVLVMMKRKEIKLKDIAERIGTSSVYARQVINGFQSGGKATEYRNQRFTLYIGKLHCFWERITKNLICSFVLLTKPFLILR